MKAFILPFEIVRFNGNKLEPYIKNGQYILIQNLDKTIKRGDIVAFKSQEGEILLGMVFALSGEKVAVENGILYINDKPFKEIRYNWDNCYFNETFTNKNGYLVVVPTNLSCSKPQFFLSGAVIHESEIIGKVFLKRDLSKLSNQAIDDFEERIISDFPKSSSPDFIHLINNKKANDPSFEELIAFLKEDDSDKLIYKDDKFMYGHFAERLHNNAEKKGIRAGVVIVEFLDNSAPYVFNIFNTIDKGIVYIDSVGRNYSSMKKNYSLQKCEFDKVAYIKEGKPLGFISIDIAPHPNDYSFYEKFMSEYENFLEESKHYELKLNDYNKRVAIYNKKYTEYEKQLNDFNKRVNDFNERVKEYENTGIGNLDQLKIEEAQLKTEGSILDVKLKELKQEKVKLDNEKVLLVKERELLIQKEKKFNTCIWNPLPAVSKIHVYW